MRVEDVELVERDEVELVTRDVDEVGVTLVLVPPQVKGRGPGMVYELSGGYCVLG